MKPASLATAAITGLLFLFLRAEMSPIWSSHCPKLESIPGATALTEMANEPPHSPPVKNQTEKNRTWRTVQVFEDKGNAVTPTFTVFGTAWSLSWEMNRDTGTSANLRIHVFQRDKPYALWQTIDCSEGGKGEKIFPIESADGEQFFLKVFTSISVSWIIRIQDNLPEMPRSAVEISHIHYRGTRYLRNTESCVCYEVVEPDEYVAIRNSGEHPQKMGGWTLKNVTKGYPAFVFPADFVLHPGQTVLITTNEMYPDCTAWLEFGTRAPYCGKQPWFSFYFGPGDIWDNKTPNTAVLYDSKGNEVSRKSYTIIGD